MRLSNRIVLATLNIDKFREFEALFKAYPELKLEPVEGLVRNAEKLAFVENYNTYAENSAAKARFVNLACHHPSIGDDSGLEVEALGWGPGVRSRRYATSTGASDTAKSGQDKANVEKLLSELKGKTGRDARFVCNLSLVVEGILVSATGTLEGTIADAPRGTNGFGYDPVFIPKGSSKSFAEMTDHEKNAISHRARAVTELMNQVKARGIVFAKP